MRALWRPGKSHQMTGVTASRAPARWRTCPRTQDPDGLSSPEIRRRAPRSVPTGRSWSIRQPEPFRLRHIPRDRQACPGHPRKPRRQCRGSRNETELRTLERARLNAMRPERPARRQGVPFSFSFVLSDSGGTHGRKTGPPRPHHPIHRTAEPSASEL